MKIQLKRSNVLDNGAAKQPTAAQMEYGEIAVNYNATDPTLFIKDSTDQIIPIAGNSYIVDLIEENQQIEISVIPPTSPPPGNGDLWLDMSQCPPELKVWTDCSGTGTWVILTGGAPRPIDPSPDDGKNDINPPVSGNGTEFDPFVLTAVEVNYGNSAESVETISFNNQTAGDIIQFVDQDEDNNGTRFAQPAYEVGEDGTWSGKLRFNDFPVSASPETFTGKLKIGANSIYYSWAVTVKAPVAVAKPEVLTPPDGAGIGGDVDYFPETSAITTVGTTPAGGLANAIDDSLDWQDVSWCIDKWVAVSQNGATRFMWSTDGISWNACTGDAVSASVSWECVEAGGGNYVACGYGNSGKNVARSTDGKVWTLVTRANTSQDLRPRSVCYDDYRDAFWIVGDQGTNRCIVSYDGGVTWANNSNLSGAVAYDIQRGPEGLFVAAGQNSYYYADTDTRFRTVSGLPSSTFYAVVYGEDKWRMITGNQVWESSNGTNWSRNGTAAFSGQQRDIAYGDGVYIAVSNNAAPGIQYSYNGVQWSLADNQDTTQQFFGCGYGDGKFIAIGRTGAKAVNYSLTGDKWSDTFVAVNLTNNLAYDSDTGQQTATIDEVFLAGDKVVGIDPNPQPGEDLGGNFTYPGSASTVTVTSGVDNTSGGYDSFIWVTGADQTSNYTHQLASWRSPNNAYRLGTTDAPTTKFSGNTFTTTGMTIAGGQESISQDGTNYAFYNFHKNSEFIDIVKYSGDDTSDRAIPHNLGTEVGFIITRNESNNASNADNWCYHKDLQTGRRWGWGTTGVAVDNTYYPTRPTTTTFNPGQGQNAAVYQDYVSYLFAADVPGVIKCGTYTGNGGTQVVDVGFKPQWVLLKSVSNSQPWIVLDNVRNNFVVPVSTSAKEAAAGFQGFSDTGFTINSGSQLTNASSDKYYYVAIAEGVDTSMFTTGGTLVADAAGTSLTLKDTVGQWVAGMTAKSETEYTKEAPGADDIVFTSSKPATTEGLVNIWGQADWQLATDASFTNKQSASVALQNVPAEQGPTSFTLEGDTEYWVRTRYNSADPAAISDWSEASHFKTANALQNGWFPVQGTLTNDGNWYDICFGDGKFVAVGKNRSAVSTDGVNWTQYNDIIPGDTSKNWKGVTFANGKFWAVGDYDAISSNDGASWTQDASHQAYKSHAIAGDGSSNLVVVGEYYNAIADKQFSYSTNNGSTWQTYGKDSATWYYIAHGNGVFMIGGTGGNASISTAGNSWANKKTQSGGSLKDVIFADGKFVLPDYGSSGTQVTWTEDNGTTWDGSSGLGGSEYWNAIAYGDGRYVAVGNKSQANQIMWSDDLQTWTGSTAPAVEDLIKVTWGNGVFVAMYNNVPSTNTPMIYSESGADVTARTLYFDVNANAPINDVQVIRRFGADPETTDLRAQGIYPLTEQPEGVTEAFTREGNAYRPLRDFSHELQTAEARVDQLQRTLSTRIGVLQAAAGIEPFAIEGYYPLYTTEAAANAASSGGTSHSHTLEGVEYYMPDGGTIYHGDYEDNGY